MSDPKSSKPRKKVSTVNAAPALGIEALNELALNLHWSWNHMADPLWEALDSYLWQTTQNPWVILQTVLEGQNQYSSGDAQVSENPLYFVAAQTQILFC